MPGEKGTDDAAAVGGDAQGAAEGRVIQGLTSRIAADVLKDRCVRVLIADIAGDTDRRCSREIGGDELHIPGGEAVKHGVLVGGFHQGDAVGGLAGATPPGLICN